MVVLFVSFIPFEHPGQYKREGCVVNVFGWSVKTHVLKEREVLISNGSIADIAGTGSII